MFDTLIREMAGRYGLGDKAKDMVSMVLAYATDPAKGGLSGLLERFRSGGMSELVASWLSDTDKSIPPNNEQVESIFGGTDGLLSSLSDKLHLPRDAATSAVGAVLPMLVSRLAPGGVVPTSLPAEAAALIGCGQSLLGGLVSSGTAALGVGAAAVGAGAAAASSAASSVASTATSTAAAAGGGMGKWLPWVVGAAIVALGVSYCGKKTPDSPPAAATAPAPSPVPAPAPAPEPVPTPVPAPAQEPAATPAASTSNVAPTGAAVLDSMVQEVPKLQVFFDSGKTDVAAEFADKSKALVAYLQSHADMKAVVSGFNDPTGDPVKNAELSKQRAMAVQNALTAAGVPADRSVLEKPAESSDAGANNAASRRVDVVLRAH
ncbi:MAG: YidB family protein [Comamonas sp.]